MKDTLPKFRGLCLAVILTAALAAPFATSAQDKEKEKPAAAGDAKEKAKDKAPRPYPFNGKLDAVDKDKKTLTIMGKEKSRMFYVDGQTKITKHEKPATLDEAIVGEIVAGQVRRADDGREVLVSLRIGPKPASADKPEKEKPAKEKAAKEKTKDK